MYQAKEERYDQMIYTRCGKSGLKLPKVSLGFWQNFGAQGQFSNMEQIVQTAFDLGITHFDLANNYGIHTMEVPKKILERSLQTG